MNRQLSFLIACAVFLFLFLTIFAFFSLGQGLEKRKVFADTSHPGNWAYLYKCAQPDSAPTIVFFHGVLQKGKTEADAERLLHVGPLKYANEGWHPDYNMIAVQWQNAAPAVSLVWNIIKNDPYLKFIDTTKLVLTGYSAGGNMPARWLNEGYPAAAISMLSPWEFVPYTGALRPCWIYHETGDPERFKVAAEKYQTVFQDQMTEYPGDHCCWNKIYNPESSWGQDFYGWIDSVLSVPSKRFHTEKVTILYEDSGIVKVDTSATIVMDEGKREIIEFRLTGGRSIKYKSRWVFIYSFHEAILPEFMD